MLTDLHEDTDIYKQTNYYWDILIKRETKSKLRDMNYLIKKVVLTPSTPKFNHQLSYYEMRQWSKNDESLI